MGVKQWTAGSGRRFVTLAVVCGGIVGLVGLLGSRSSTGLASVSSSASSWDHEVSDFCVGCTDSQKECTTSVVGNDGQTRYKRVCCELSDECGTYKTPGERWESPVCIPKHFCDWTDYGRTHHTEYDPEKQCCSSEFGVLQKYPIIYLGQCKHPVPHPGYESVPNGCGTKEHPVNPTDSEGKYKGRANFTSACNTHDACYDRCNSGKAPCDKQLEDDMNAECNSKYKARSPELAHCKKMVKNWFIAGVQTIFGSWAYDDAQQKACQCCQ